MQSMHVTNVLSTYIDGALTEGERTQVERHLETCEECRRHLSALRDLVTTLRSAEPVAAPEGFREQVRARVEQMGPRQDVARRWPSISTPWRVISAAAAVLVIGIFAANLLRTQGPVAMRELDKPGESQIASGDRLRSAAPSAPEVAQRTISKQRPSVARGIVLIALPVLTLSTLAWIAIRRRRSRRAW